MISKCRKLLYPIKMRLNCSMLRFIIPKSKFFIFNKTLTCGKGMVSFYDDQVGILKLEKNESKVIQRKNGLSFYENIGIHWRLLCKYISPTILMLFLYYKI